MLTTNGLASKSSRDETSAALGMADDFAAALDAKMQRGNEHLHEHILAWAELLDAAGWCVALRMDADGCWISDRAGRFLANDPGIFPTWSGLALVLAKEAPVTLEWSERVAIWCGNDGEIPLPEATLTRRESEVMEWLRQGKTCPEIAVILGLSHRTVEKHVSNTYRKTGVSSRTAMILNRGHQR